MYKTRIASDFFNLKGLETRTGLSLYNWYLAIIKELIDNALDAIESNSVKQINIEYTANSFKVFDNGIGFTVDNVKDIYDFDNYVSKNRHIILASRGKQGNGLKSIIGMCYVKKHNLLWHTSNGTILTADFNADIAEDMDLDISFIESGETDKRGIEIQGIYLDKAKINTVVYEYSECNPDVNFIVNINGNRDVYEASTEPVDKTDETSLAFYNYQSFVRLINVQEKTETYKNFLGKYFGTRIKNESTIKGKIQNLDFDKVQQDFLQLKSVMNTKPYTLLKRHLIGFKNILETNVHQDKEVYPCLVEFQVEKLENKRDKPTITCYVNNSITYKDGLSITYDYSKHKISNTRKVVDSYNLFGLLEEYEDYEFYFHIISPYLNYNDFGKTEINITDFITELVDSLRKALNKEKKRSEISKEKIPSKKFFAEKYMTDAFLLASSDGKYSITARQMYYKLRELVGRENPKWESDSTYSEFTQKWLTSWLEENEEYESKVNFSERGNFYVEGSQMGLGTASVRRFIDEADTKTDKFQVYGGLQDSIHIDDKQFNIRYKYDKALYIEKTGFDGVFQAEKLDQKYNLLIVSGQGFASRCARRFLHHLSQQGIKLYCLHDLDISGINIYNSMCKANNKFDFDLEMVNLGVTPKDVERYGVVPEVVDAVDTQILLNLDDEHRRFFDNGAKSQRVEINAFSTEQLLNLIDSKLSGICNLPTINISKSLELDKKALREVALMRIIKAKYSHLIEDVSIDCDLSEYDGIFTLPETKDFIPEIKEDLIRQYQTEIESRIAI